MPQAGTSQTRRRRRTARHGAPGALVACSVGATFTAGFALLLLPVYWVGVMMQVYWIEDRKAK